MGRKSGKQHTPEASTITTLFPTDCANVQVDGSLHEGGGQMVRTSVGLASALQTSVHISRVRAGRSTPGLRPQHVSGAVLAAALGGGTLSGAKVRSMEMRYDPSTNPPSQDAAEAKLATAGAVALVWQAALPVLITRAPKSVAVLGGGTHVPHAPTAEYVQQVFVPNAKRFGVLLEYDVRRRGFFPRGGAAVDIKLSLETGTVRPWQKRKRAPICRVRGIIVAGSSRLVETGAAASMRKGARAVLRARFGEGFEEMGDDATCDVDVLPVDNDAIPGPTLAITLVAETNDGGALGTSRSLDERSARESGFCSIAEAAEDIGRELASQLVEDVLSEAPVDRLCADQLVTLMALAHGTSRIGVPAISLHMKSVQEVLARFGLPLQFETGDDGVIEMVCMGKGDNENEVNMRAHEDESTT